MPYTPGFIPGDRLVECEICGFTYRYSQMRRGVSRDQKGVIVCPDDFDLPHPNDEKPKIRTVKGPEPVR